MTRQLIYRHRRVKALRHRKRKTGMPLVAQFPLKGTSGLSPQLDSGTRKKRKKGFVHELVHNRILFLMLLPTLLFFLINSYFPMVGVYYAFHAV